MYLFFNGVSSQWYIALFWENREIIASSNFEISGNESTQTIPIIDAFLSEQNIQYTDIKNIVTVVWPGSFTWIRTISLVVNTLAYIYPNIELTAVNFFDLYTAYPIIKSSSKRDLFVKYKESDIIQIVKNDDFIAWCSEKTIYGDCANQEINWAYQILGEIDYIGLIKKIVFQSNKKLAPLYIKKPNIT